MSLFEILDLPIAFHRAFVTIAGSVDGAVFLSQAVYWQGRMGREWWKTAEEWEAETGIKKERQLTIRRQLAKTGVLSSKRKGLPAKVYFSVDEQKLAKLLNIQVTAESRDKEGLGAPTVSGSEPQQYGAESRDILYTETTSETTTETSKFDTFWDLYPKKVEKKKCQQKWKTRKLDRLADLIIADITRRRIDDAQWQDGYIPNPLTYINGDRWEDEIQTRRPSHNAVASANQDALNAFLSNQPLQGDFTRE